MLALIRVFIAAGYRIALKDNIVIAHPFITDVLNDEYSITASLVVMRDVWPTIWPLSMLIDDVIASTNEKRDDKRTLRLKRQFLKY